MDQHTAKTPINSGTRNMKLVYDAPSFSLGLTQEDLVTVVSNPLQLGKSGRSKEIRSKFRNNEVVFKNIEPTEMELAKLEIPQKDGTEDERSVDSDDDFQDPPPKKINERSKKKQKVDSSTLVVKKPSGKKQVNIVDAHTQMRTLPYRAAKAAVMKTPVQSKADSHVEEVTVLKRESHVEKETFISKKVFDAFREEVRQEFKEIREEFTQIR
ncbi:hypothetical protein FXO38_24059 [Capsicum annuum]|nr:hypothetical protein FXO38_24059 [Capsicum annuum]